MSADAGRLTRDIVRMNAAGGALVSSENRCGDVVTREGQQALGDVRYAERDSMKEYVGLSRSEGV